MQCSYTTPFAPAVHVVPNLNSSNSVEIVLQSWTRSRGDLAVGAADSLLIGARALQILVLFISRILQGSMTSKRVVGEFHVEKTLAKQAA